MPSSHKTINNNKNPLSHLDKYNITHIICCNIIYNIIPNVYRTSHLHSFIAMYISLYNTFTTFILFHIYKPYLK